MKKLKTFSNVLIIVGIILSLIGFWFSVDFIKPTFSKSVTVPICIVSSLFVVSSFIIDFICDRKKKNTKKENNEE